MSQTVLETSSEAVAPRGASQAPLVQICTTLLHVEISQRRNLPGYYLQKGRGGNHQILDGLSAQDRAFFLDHVYVDRSWDKTQDYLKSRCSVEFDRARDAWTAFASSVLLHPDVTDDVAWNDIELGLAICQWKRWFFKNYWRSASIRGGEVVLPNSTRTVTALKNLSKWITWYGSFNQDGNVPCPPRDEWLPGQVTGYGYQILSWYAGSLQKWSRPWTLEPTKHNVFCLAQMASFGRAFPTPPKVVCVDEERSVLTYLGAEPGQVYTENRVWITQTFSDIASHISRRLGPMMGKSHMSMNASACYEASQAQGGFSSHLVTEILRFGKKPTNEFFSSKELDSFYSLSSDPEPIYDPLGREVFPAYYVRGELATSHKLGNLPISETCYRISNEMSARRDKVSLSDDFTVHLQKVWPNDPNIKGLLTECLGDICLLWAWFEAMKYGHFEGPGQIFYEQEEKESYPFHTLRIYPRTGHATFRCTGDSACRGECTTLQNLREMGIISRDDIRMLSDIVGNIEDDLDEEDFLVEGYPLTGGNYNKVKKFDLAAVAIILDMLHDEEGDPLVEYRLRRRVKTFVEYNDNTPLPFFKGPGIRVWVQDKPIPCGLMTLSEPGWKARTLTKNMVWLTMIQAVCRHMVADHLGGDARVGLGLQSSYVLWDLLKGLGDQRFERAINTDLTRSTDRIPLSLIQAMWKGYDEGLRPVEEPNRLNALTAFRPFIAVKHVMEHAEGSTPQKCGSFMGEPMSFMTLSLYNLCVLELSTLSIWQNCLPQEVVVPTFDYAPILLQYSRDAVIGDDALRLALKEGRLLGLRTREVYRLTNATLSIGKDTESVYHGILAENHIYLEEGKPLYLDIIKSRYLSWVHRLHADNRSSVIGKGSALMQALEWYEEPNPRKPLPLDIRVKRQQMVARVQGVYLRTLGYKFSPKVTSALNRLPVWLRPSLGGLSLPYNGSDHTFVVNWLQFMVRRSSTGLGLLQALPLSIELKGLNRPRKRRFELPDLTKVLEFLEIPDLGAFEGRFNPQDESFPKEALIPLKNVLREFKADGIFCGTDITISPITGEPRVRSVLRYVYDTFGYVPMESILDQYDRFLTFGKILRGETQTEHLSLEAYLGNLERFWQNAKGAWNRTDYPHLYQPVEMPPRKELSELSWQLHKLSMTLVHRDIIREGLLSMGPTLNVSVNRIRVRKETRSGFNEQLETAVNAWFMHIHMLDEEGEVPT